MESWQLGATIDSINSVRAEKLWPRVVLNVVAGWPACVRMTPTSVPLTVSASSNSSPHSTVLVVLFAETAESESRQQLRPKPTVSALTARERRSPAASRRAQRSAS